METILTTELENTDKNQNMGGPSFNTKDKVFLHSSKEIELFSNEIKADFPPDYSIMNGVACYAGWAIKSNWLRNAISNTLVASVSYDGKLVYDALINNLSCRPVFHLSLPFFACAQKSTKFGKVKITNEEAFVELGEYPLTYAENNEQLERLFKNGKLTKTGKNYTGFLKKDGNFQLNDEFEFNGKRYARVACLMHDEDKYFTSGIKAPRKTGDIVWADIQPITWIITNWKDLPKEINPNGNGKAEYVELLSKRSLIGGIPFFPTYMENASFWQNSPIRAYLNGYDIYEELTKGNGNAKFKAQQNFNCKEHNFFHESGLDGLEALLTKEEKAQIEREELARKHEKEKLIDEENQAKWNDWVDWANKQYGLDDRGQE